MTPRAPRILDLVRRAEDVRVVLCEAPDAGQSGNRSRQLVAMQAAEIGERIGSSR